MVTCPNGHRFPVNKKKHTDRNYRFCPHKGCGTRVTIKSPFSFSPNSNWSRIKEEREQTRIMMKEMKESRSRQPSHEALLLESAARVSMETVMRAAVELSKREKQKET